MRMLFATGILGLILYIRMLFMFFRRSILLGPAQRFLLYATFAALLFYSISVTPTFYAPFMYFTMAVFAYTVLPENMRMQWKNQEF
jgi:hypothetical protein